MNKTRLLFVLSIAPLLLAGCERDPETTADTRPAGAAARPRKTVASEISAIAGEDVEAKVVRIVAEQMGVKPSEVNARTHLKRDLKADELDQVELVMEVEDAFGLSIEDADAEKLQTVGDFVNYVRARRK